MRMVRTNEMYIDNKLNKIGICVGADDDTDIYVRESNFSVA